MLDRIELDEIMIIISKQDDDDDDDHEPRGNKNEIYEPGSTTTTAAPMKPIRFARRRMRARPRYSHEQVRALSDRLRHILAAVFFAAAELTTSGTRRSRLPEFDDRVTTTRFLPFFDRSQRHRYSPARPTTTVRVRLPASLSARPRTELAGSRDTVLRGAEGGEIGEEPGGGERPKRLLRRRPAAAG
eukprot:CAMPEP_0197177084 /NCGR_PEP_ID=MMETSP1423-20130617/2816_1 /TAXON_ID=476441 /ORGANISM="Pseudo-nitzschia heimii, Strain UNC1101" /LENGTH=186 /DNA_ID=CAMNT_0042626575 /DNA_START=6 /DNA_END=563 /DNA_ORIENTATION=+